MRKFIFAILLAIMCCSSLVTQLAFAVDNGLPAEDFIRMTKQKLGDTITFNLIPIAISKDGDFKYNGMKKDMQFDLCIMDENYLYATSTNLAEIEKKVNELKSGKLPIYVAPRLWSKD